MALDEIQLPEPQKPAQRRADVLPASLPPRGLSRGEAARFIGVSPTKFDEMVDDGRMPKPKQIDARRVWDRKALDRAFDELPDDNERDDPWSKVEV